MGVGRARLEEVENEVSEEMDAAAERALASRDLLPPPEAALYDGFSQGGVLDPILSRPV